MTEMKTYIQPTMTVVKIQTGTFMIQSNLVNDVESGDTDILFDTSITTGDARVKQNNINIWDDEW